MQHPTLLHLAAIFLVFSHANAADPVATGQVTLPYPEFRALTDRADNASKTAAEAAAEKDQPPVKFTVSSMAMEITLAPDSCLITADFEIETFTDSWHSIPLIGGDLQLSSVESDERILIQDAKYSLLCQGAGSKKIRLNMIAPGLDQWKTENGISLEPSTAAIATLSVNGIPESSALLLNGLIQKKPLAIHLPADGGKTTLALTQNTTPKPLIESDWKIDSETLVRFDQDHLAYESRLFCHADTGDAKGLAVSLPRQSRIVDISSDDALHWAPGTNSDESQSVRIDWKTPGIRNRTLTLQYEIPLSPLAEAWTLHLPSPLKGSQGTGFVVIQNVDALELNAPALRPARESRRLPDWITKALLGSPFITAQTDTPQIDITSVKWLPRLELAPAIIKNATVKSRFVSDGSLLVEASYEVALESPTDWILELPEGSDLINCALDGVRTSPIERSKGTIELPLRANANKPVTISLSYTQQFDRFDPVSGSVSVTLPKTPLFIHAMHWQFALPEGYETIDAEGTVEVAQPVKCDDPKSCAAVFFKQELIRDQSPQAQIYYRRSTGTN